VKFSELVRLLERNEFDLFNPEPTATARRGSGDVDTPSPLAPGQTTEGGWNSTFVRGRRMLSLTYSLVIEATEEPDFFGFYSEDLQGFSGVGHSIEDCLYQAKWGMDEHVALLREQRLPVPPGNADPTVTIRNQPARRKTTPSKRRRSPRIATR
jgi:predicted RNase H-like HicB family nuclease